MPSSAKTVLFICSGNIYRSRFAEAYFNHRAEQEGLEARAISRGLLVDLVREDISELTVQALAERGIPRDRTAPGRQALSPEDLESADIVVALRESEHRPLVEARFPKWATKFRYWDVADRDEWPTDQMLKTVEENTDRLLEELRPG